MPDWNSIIWFIIWAVVIFAAAVIAIWIAVASFAARRFKAIRKDFDKGFDSDFFKRNR